MGANESPCNESGGEDPLFVEKVLAPSESYDAVIATVVAFVPCCFQVRMVAAAQGKQKHLDICGSLRASQIYDTVFGKLGDPLAIGVNFETSGSDIVLRMVNGEAFAVSVSVFKNTPID